MPDPGWPRFQHPEETALKLGMSTPDRLDTEDGHFRGPCDALEAMNISAAAFYPLLEAMATCQAKRQSLVEEGKEASLVQEKHDAEWPTLKSFPAIDLVAGGTVVGGLCMVATSRMRRLRQQTDDQLYTDLLSGSDARAS
eukprot:gnl/TRDRNA2_/TRDRNA2_143598_c2_seq1.p1 gnl/TRDRNA2_/TRDRNA2_143598_c2~~gnl/TRDRNA2_/TRDRNA2_143598_c2_seq1.p1  ORF type:complete len:158 (-),score=30.74 gnl/TRDRNA2_/TRDRNA2_143598_c2_seq1:12-431(-)